MTLKTSLPARSHRLEAMSRIDWSFGPLGFFVQVVAPNGMESTISGDTPTEDISIQVFSRTPVPAVNPATVMAAASAAASTGRMVVDSTTTPAGGTIVVHSPVEFRANFPFGDDGTMEASWQTSLSGGVVGKGSGKGMGKNTTVRRI